MRRGTQAAEEDDEGDEGLDAAEDDEEDDEEADEERGDLADVSMSPERVAEEASMRVVRVMLGITVRMHGERKRTDRWARDGDEWARTNSTKRRRVSRSGAERLDGFPRRLCGACAKRSRLVEGREADEAVRNDDDEAGEEEKEEAEECADDEEEGDGEGEAKEEENEEERSSASSSVAEDEEARAEEAEESETNEVADVDGEAYTRTR
jgi:hypothetical protein